MGTSCGRGPSRGRSRRLWPALLGAPLCGLLLTTPGMAQHGPLLHAPGPARSVSPVVHDARPSNIQRVENTTHRPLPPMIEALPTVQEELEIIERRSQLMVTRGNLLRVAIADPSIIDVVQYSPREFSIIGLGRGSTTLTMWFDSSPDPLIYLVRVVRDPNVEYQKRIDYGKLEKKLAILFPNSKVYLIPLSYKIVVRGQARDAEEAAQILSIIRGEIINQEGSLFGPQPVPPAGAAGTPGYPGLGGYDLASSYIINQLRVPGEYTVMLRVRIAELNRSQLRRLGIDLNALFNDGRHFIATSMAGAPGTITGLFENGEVGVFLDWLASNGTAKILDEPTLTVLSGRTASFLSGGEFAVPTIIGIDGASGQTTTFRGFGTSLIVTPTVVQRDLIRMQVISEFSTLNQDNAVNNIPGTNARRVNTTVELREGQTLALAGLISHQTTTEVTRIPFLGDLPWVGPLFSAKRATQDETELLILVTPELGRPMDAQEVPPVPGFEVTLPSDHELFKYGMTEGSLPDTGYYQLPPYGSGSIPTNVGYQNFNPGPASPMYSPVPTAPYGVPTFSPSPLPDQGFPTPLPAPGQTSSGVYAPLPGQPMLPPPTTGPMPGPVMPGYSSPNNLPPAPNYSPPPAPGVPAEMGTYSTPSRQRDIQPAAFQTPAIPVPGYSAPTRPRPISAGGYSSPR